MSLDEAYAYASSVMVENMLHAEAEGRHRRLSRQARATLAALSQASALPRQRHEPRRL